MTAKQAVFLALEHGTVDLPRLREQHRSIQTRKVGKDIVQIRFRDSESWMNLEDFHSNYRNKVLKDVNDLLTASSKVLPPKELLNGLTSDLRRIIINAGIRNAIEGGICVTKDKHDSVVRSYCQVMNEKVDVEEALISVSEERDELLKRCEGYKRDAELALSTLRRLKEEIGEMGKFGMVKVSDVLGKFDDVGV
jgi:hypothetical protein